MPSYRLVLGTRNQKKRSELVELLGPHGFDLKTLDEYPDSIEVDETGVSFQENADLKSTQQAKLIGEWVLGEDSGLVVAKLNGQPGIMSARYAGPDATDADNNRKLLQELADVPLDERSAHYVCHMSLSDPHGKVHVNCEGHCHGRILFHESGSGGFGYDPMFEIAEYHQTFGELGSSVKSVLSHRARASRMLVPQLIRLVARGVWKV